MDARGKQRKVPLSQLSEEDRLYIELAQPPKFNIAFSKQSSQRFFKESPIYILFDRQEIDFTPTRENGRAHTFRGDTIPVRELDISYLIYRRGQKYGGDLIVVTDERGIIVDHKASHEWLIGIVDNLRELPKGKHFDKTGVRVGPPRPRRHLY